MFFGELDDLLLDGESLAAADAVHVAARPVCRVGLLAKVQVLLLGVRRPEGVHIQHLRKQQRVAYSEMLCASASRKT